jgi:hypothetical protein
MAGRFSNCHKRCIREEDEESNNRPIDKRANTDVSIIVILINRLFSFTIRALKEDPLSTGMLDVFFPKNLIMCLSY